MTTTEDVIRLAREAGFNLSAIPWDQYTVKGHLVNVERLISLAKAEALAEGWMPIETAPLDRTVLVYPPTWPSKTCSTAQFVRDQSAKKPRPYWERDDALRLVWKSRETPPTHWRPLPPPPSMKEAA